MMQFQYTEYLLALCILPLLILLYFFAVKRKKSIAQKMGDPALVKSLLKEHSSRKFLLKFLMLTTAVTLCCLALANLRSPQDSRRITRTGIDVIFALDVSNSMLAEDIAPSRLERAKLVLNKLVSKLGNNRVGLIVFAGKSYLQMPVTSDHAAAKMFISSASPSAIPSQGTVIADALKMAGLSFNNNDKKFKAVVLLSDGEDHDDQAVEQAKEMATSGVIIHTVAIGSPRGSTIPDKATGSNKLDENGNLVISKVNEAALKELASAGKGIYQLYSNTETVVNNIMGELNSMDQRTVIDDSLINYKSFFQFFLLAAFLLLITELFISEKRRLRKVKKPVVTVTLLLFFLSGFSQEKKEIIKQGNDLYESQKYAEAAEAYKEAAEGETPEFTSQFNLGNALFKDKKPDEAQQAYDKALAAAILPIDKSEVYYNKGVVYQVNNKIDECIEAYKNCLRINPNDEDARQNLQKALKKKKEEEQKKKDQDQNKKKDAPQKKQQSRLSKADSEEKLKALQQQERNLHDKLKKGDPQPVTKPVKDW